MRIIRYLIGVLLIFLALALPQITSGQGGRILETVASGSGSALSNPAISLDGQTVAFSSDAAGLVSGDANQSPDIFIHNRALSKVQRVSIRPDGTEANGGSFLPALSADGRFVAFASQATNLIDGEASAFTRLVSPQVYLVDRTTRLVTLVSRPSGTDLPDGLSTAPSISGDGRYITYASLAQNLVTADRNPGADIYVYDREKRETRLVSQVNGEKPYAGWALSPVISADGRWIAFLHIPTQLPTGDPGAGRAQLYLHDQVTHRTDPIHLVVDDLEWEPGLGGVKITADGSYLLVAGHSSDQGLLLYRRSDRKTILVPRSRTSLTGSLHFALAPFSRWTVFLKKDPGSQPTWYEYDRTTGVVQRLEDLPISLNAPPEMSSPVLSGSGQVLAFSAQSPPSQSGTYASLNLYKSERSSSEETPTTTLSGWVTDGYGHTLAGIEVSVRQGPAVTTGLDGSFRLEGLVPGEHRLRLKRQGYSFTPEGLRLQVAEDNLETIGLAFTAIPTGVVAAARQDLGMPYSQLRGCPSPFTACGGPFNGFYSGDCTDLVLDAYRVGAGFNLHDALQLDIINHPEHYYYWRNARSSQDLWRYFSYTSQLLPDQDSYLPGDIVFFDWEADGTKDHVAIVSDVDENGRPKQLLDATGVTGYNASGLASELAWQAFHEAGVRGHGRWVGITHRLPAFQPDSPLFLAALDSPGLSLQLIDAKGQVISASQVDIPGGTFIDLGESQVVALPGKFNPGSLYLLQISGKNGGSYTLGLQALDKSLVTANVQLEGELKAGEIIQYPVQLAMADESPVFQVVNP